MPVERSGQDRNGLATGAIDGAERKSGPHTVLAMRFEDYVELLVWTGRCVEEGKRGVLPESARPVLERMELDTENWVGTVERHGSIYRRVAGKMENLPTNAQGIGQRWLAGRSAEKPRCFQA